MKMNDSCPLFRHFILFWFFQSFSIWQYGKLRPCCLVGAGHGGQAMPVPAGGSAARCLVGAGYGGQAMPVPAGGSAARCLVGAGYGGQAMLVPAGGSAARCLLPCRSGVRRTSNACPYGRVRCLLPVPGSQMRHPYTRHAAVQVQSRDFHSGCGMGIADGGISDPARFSDPGLWKSRFSSTGPVQNRPLQNQAKTGFSTIHRTTETYY